MKIRRRMLAAAAAATTSLGVAVAGAVVLTPAEAAKAVLQETDYGFQGTSFGTQVKAEMAGLQSSRSAFSYQGCTRLAGKLDEESLASVKLPPGSTDDPLIEVNAIDSQSKTFRDRKDDIDAAIRTRNSIGMVELGQSATPKLRIQELKTTSMAWATTGGELKAKNVIKSADIDLLDLPAEIPPELQDLVDATEGGINDVLATIVENGGDIEIPGLGRVQVGAFDRINGSTAKGFKGASSKVLLVTLYGENTVEGGGDDAVVTIGRSWARITKGLPAGVMNGEGFGASGEVVDGVLGIGKLGEQGLPCQGTDGEVLEGPVVGLGPAGAPFDLATLVGRAFGVQKRDGSARAWTEGEVAGLEMGPLEINGIVGRVNVKQNARGQIVRNDIDGSSVAEIIVDGDSQGGLTPEEAKDMPPMEIPGVGSIEFFKKDRTARGTRVSAVVITFLPDTPMFTELRLGNARTVIKRY